MTRFGLKEQRNAQIVRMIDDQKLTMTAVGKYFNISKQRVQQIYRKAKQNVQDIRTPGNGQDNNAS